MDVIADLPVDAQAAEPVQARERALDNPTLGTEAGTMLGAAAGDDRLHAEVPDEPTVLVVVVTAVPKYGVRAAARSAALASHGRYCLKQWDELGDIVAVAAGRSDRERDACGVRDQVKSPGAIRPSALGELRRVSRPCRAIGVENLAVRDCPVRNCTGHQCCVYRSTPVN